MRKPAEHLPKPLPKYLTDTYWWAYLTPEAIRFFDRPWVTNTILWGQYQKLTQQLIEEASGDLQLQIVQIGCVYGNMTSTLYRALQCGSKYTVIDVAPIQLEHLSTKLAAEQSRVDFVRSDATEISLDSSYSDLTVLFFLIHELPHQEKKLALAEAWRITKPHGKLVVVDYHRPSIFNPIRLLMHLILKKLEPFATELWDTEIETLLNCSPAPHKMIKKTFFGGLYQKVTLIKG